MKPLGIAWDLQYGMKIVRPHPSEDRLWDALQDWFSSGNTPAGTKEFMNECWEDWCEQQKKDGKI